MAPLDFDIENERRLSLWRRHACRKGDRDGESWPSASGDNDEAAMKGSVAQRHERRGYGPWSSGRFNKALADMGQAVSPRPAMEPDFPAES
jgi:hypothetical protein